jgi:Chaperone of endosialidase
MKRIQAFFALLAIPLSISAQNMGIKLPVSTLPNTTLDVNGAVSYREGTALNLTSLVNDNIALSDMSFYRITGAIADFSVTGFTNGKDGRMLFLINSTSFNMTLGQQTVTSSAANQINTGSGTDLIIGANGMVTLMYNLALQKWVVFSKSGEKTNWGLTGNGGTNASTNFIGTTDAQGLIFKTNGVTAMSLDVENRGGTLNITNRKFGGTVWGSFIGFKNMGYPSGIDTSMIIRGAIGANDVFVVRGVVKSNTASTDGELHIITGDDGNEPIVFEQFNSGTGVYSDRLRIHSNGNIGLGHNSPSANLHVYGTGQSGFTPTSHGITAVHGAEIAFSANGFNKPAASIQLLDYNAYSSGLAFNVHKGTSNGGTGLFADNWPTDVIQAMTIDNRGYVGIGTGTPSALLHLSSNGNGLYNDMLISGYNASDWPVFNFRRARGTEAAPLNVANGDGIGGVNFHTYVNSGWSFLSSMNATYKGDGTTNLSNLIFQTSNATQMTLTENGRLGINTASPDQPLSVNGNASKAGGGSWATFSDSRVKHNVRQFTDGLATLEKINPVWFQYNNKSGYADTSKIYVGVIAQEVEKVAPYMVEKTKTATFDDQRVYDSNALNYILVNSVKELSVENKKLKAENEAVNAELAKLKADNNALKYSVEKNNKDIESIKAMLEKKQ